MKIKSFGCSFIYGTDLPTILGHPSEVSWPALIAKKLSMDYECFAVPGQGNFKIMCDLVNESSLDDDDTLFIVGWTWIDRYDYIDWKEHWNTLRPAGDNDLEKFYYKNLHSQWNDMIKTVSEINFTIEYLTSQNKKFLMTYMDYSMLDPVDPNWQDPRYLTIMQNKIRPCLNDFEGKNFLDWSREKGYPVSDTLHPLIQAHAAAADYMMPAIESILRTA